MAQQHQQQHQQFSRQAAVVDLTSPEDEAKRRIVEHARRQLAQQQQQQEQQQPSKQEPITIELSDDDDDEAAPGPAADAPGAKRQRSTRQHEHAADEQKQRAAQQQQEQQHRFPEPMLYPMRDVLKAAHQERMKRLHEMQQHPQQPEQEDEEMAGGTPTAGKRGRESGGAAANIVAVPSPSKGSLNGPSPKRRFGGDTGPGAGGGAGAAPASTQQPWAPAQPQNRQAGRHATVKVLTWNIWFAEPVALQERMQGLADTLLSLEPDVLMFQEVTNNMVRLWFEQHSWLADLYTFSPPPAGMPYYTMLAFRKGTMRPLATSAAQAALLGSPNLHTRLFQRWPFDNSEMGRDLLSVALQPSQQPQAPPLLVATSHLESPLGNAPDKNMSGKRAQQVALALPQLERTAAAVAALAQPQRAQQQQQARRAGGGTAVDVLWGGDFNWNKTNSDPQLPDAWEDVWPSHPEARAPGEPLAGFTYDPKRNVTIAGSRYPPARLDRFFGRLEQWQVDSMQLVGTEPLPGVSAMYYNKRVQVHISDHFGVLLKLRWDGQ